MKPRRRRSSAATRWVRHLLPLTVFVAGWSLETVVDYDLRLADGDVTTGGLGRELWFQLHLALAAFAVGVGLWAHGTLGRRRMALVLLLQLAVVSPIYVAACLCYGVGAGIDSL